MFAISRNLLVSILLCSYATSALAILNATITSAARTEQKDTFSAVNIKTISSEEIQATSAIHIIDVLRSQSSLLIEDTFGDGSRAVISMRGFSGSTANSNTLIMIDSRRLNNTDTSNPDLNSISLKDVERIEIIEGSAGVVFGDQAVGGVINIITKKNKGKVAMFSATIGSYRTENFRAAYADNVTKNLHYEVSAESRTSDNYRSDNNEIQYSSLQAKANYTYSNGEVFAEVQTINENLNTPGALLAFEAAADRRQTFVDFLNDYTNTDTDVIRLSLKHKINDHWSIEGETSLRDVAREIQQSFRGFAVLTPSSLLRKQLDFTPRLIGSLPTAHGNIQITAGIDLINTDFNSAITSSSDDQKMLAEYAQVVYPVSNKINITAGFRHAEVEDNVTSTFTNGKQTTSVDVAELGFLYKPSNQLKLFGRIDQNFRFAKVDELTFVSPGTQLRPQTGDSIEIGFQLDRGNANLSVTLYQLSLVDEISFDSTAVQPVGSFFAGANVNFDPTTHQGLIFSGQYDVSQKLNVRLGYTYTDAVFDTGVFANNAISGVPENSANLALNYHHTDTLDINVAATYVGSRYLDGDNLNLLNKLPNHTVINTNFLYREKDTIFSFKINNLMNRKFAENANSFGSIFPSPEINVLLSLTQYFR